ncbi:MAG TPA: ABC transporter permease subunit [Gemmatimonadales bacterium]|jgi:Cu-processing system permease protein
MNAVARFGGVTLRGSSRYRGLVATAAILMIAGELLIRFGGGGLATIVSLLDVVLIVTPLVALVAGTVQVHQAREVTELLLAQPVTRRTVFIGLYRKTVLPLMATLAIGLVAPFVWHGLLDAAMLGQLGGLVLAAWALAMIGSALAFVIAVAIENRVRALGVALAAWLAAAVLWDGALLLGAMVWGDRPIELPLLGLLAFNPIDLARVQLLIGTDAAALSGYTGAVVQHVIGTSAGHLYLIVALTLWLIGPLWFAAKTFQRKDF